MFGSNCFFLETTPSKKALLFSSFLSKAFSTDSTLFPKAMISELLFNISVIASTNNSSPLDLISSFIAFSNSSCLSKTAGILTVFTCAITNFVPSLSKLFAS